MKQELNAVPAAAEIPGPTAVAQLVGGTGLHELPVDETIPQLSAF